jgi:hypothetical protein
LYPEIATGLQEEQGLLDPDFCRGDGFGEFCRENTLVGAGFSPARRAYIKYAPTSFAAATIAEVMKVSERLKTEILKLALCFRVFVIDASSLSWFFGSSLLLLHAGSVLVNGAFLFAAIDRLEGSAAAGPVQGLILGPARIPAVEITEVHGHFVSLLSFLLLHVHKGSSLRRQVREPNIRLTLPPLFHNIQKRVPFQTRPFFNQTK